MKNPVFMPHRVFFELKSGLCLYEKVHKIHVEYLETRDAAIRVSEACHATDEYIKNLEKARTEHFNQLQIQKLLDQGDLYQFDSDVTHFYKVVRI